MAKEPHELKWVEELLPEGGFRRKSMFGGFAYYLGPKLVLVTFEGSHEPWNGCMFPVEKEHHAKALALFPFLVPHPVLAKWLYLPLETENFEDLVSAVMKQVVKPQGYWGSFPKPKRNALSPVADDVANDKIDTRRPRMFSDEPAAKTLPKAKKISDLKNLGPVTEREFQKAGIKTAQAFIKLGWKKSLVKLVKVNPKNRHTLFAYALIGALTNTLWNRISEAQKQEARDFVRALPKPRNRRRPSK